MSEKRFLRLALLGISLLMLLDVLGEFFFGVTDIFADVLVLICYFIIALVLIYKIIDTNFLKYKEYKKYEEGYKYLKAVHRARYKLYFIGEREKIKEYSTEIERCGNAMLTTGEYYISNNTFNKSKTENIRQILNQTKKLMTSESYGVRGL